MDNQNEPQIVPPLPSETVRVEDIVNTPQAVTGEIVEEPNGAGRPTKYNEEMLRKTKYYFDLCRGDIDNQTRFPYIEELALRLDVDEDTITNWAKEHEEYFGTIKKIKNLQKLRLLQRGFKATNPTFSIFLLKVNHGYIETEKRILAGERESDPVQVTIKEHTPASEVAKHIADNATS